MFGGVAHLPILEGHPASGLLIVEGYAPVSVAWGPLEADGEPGRCLGEPVELKPGGAVVTGTVTYARTGEPDPEAWVEGCGNMGRTDDEGVYYLEVVPEPCVLLAMRQGGALRSVSPPTPITPQVGPASLSTGWPGGSDSLGRRGVRIEALVEGGSAARAGLLEDDVIVAIDGDAVSEFVERVELPAPQ